MDTYYDRLNAFFKENARAALASEDQLVMLHLLHCNNQTGNTGSFYLTDRQLINRTNLTKSQITAAKRRLKNLNLIDFKTNPKAPRAGTQYTLPPLKKLDVKTKTDGDYLSENSAQVKHAWRTCAGENLTGAKAFAMIQLENVYGTQAVVDAINRADLSNTAPRLTINYVKAILENKKGEINHAGTSKKPAAATSKSTGAAVGRFGGADEFDHDVPPEYRKYMSSKPAT